MTPAAGPRTKVMGVVNVTPDSFSDGGKYLDAQAAIDHAHALVGAGADIIDVGGESTRPGAEPVDEEVEQDRVLPVIRELAAAEVTVSVDSMNASTARAAVTAGATIINDVSGAAHDPDMLRAMAHAGQTVVLQHWRGAPGVMDSLATYDDVLDEVRTETAARLNDALAAGIATDRIVLDPGLGFAKTAAQSWQLLARLDALESLGFPLLVGASRKRFLTELIEDGDSADGAQRDHITAAISAIVATRPVWAVRVHNVAPTAAAVQVAHHLLEHGMKPTGDR